MHRLISGEGAAGIAWAFLQRPREFVCPRDGKSGPISKQ